MTRRQRLKVFRTPIGFHDAYVAATSQKAALSAWGADADLFARGAAELVTNEELSREPLENPGKIIKRLRGTAEDHMASLPPVRIVSDGHSEDIGLSAPKEASATEKAHSRATKGKQGSPKRASSFGPKPKPKPKRRPRPSREALDEAEGTLMDITERQEREENALRNRELGLERERHTMEKAHQRELRAAEHAVEQERIAHTERLERWIDDREG